eukprot:CAMPEP_0202898920 /NCGR_PEP_ID=MMETSP1392-20130828/7306_1 /ASSEMBLY_ACC=CAM_ASM_000868 /TAXON_ID=225041 /ORGANISM="Chlamydomonas chlamydogama, Strain SAG 11-48b" /LENGTH=324 /DNA_ID=CAMNT_0049584987 /DNA_START=91 /DNA_END=1065 /DNA_ORIENTATION=+
MSAFAMLKAGSAARLARASAGRSRSRAVKVFAANYDPDNLFKGIPVASGLINRRMGEKQMKKENKEFMAAMKLAEDEIRKEVLVRRESRNVPDKAEELVEYFLNTVAEDMEFEVSRCRPKLDKEFFRHLDGVIGKERFAPQPDEDRLAELDALRQYLTAACEALDTAVNKTASAKDRLTKLLTSKDKKACILDMAAANEIDQPLMDLLQQNIQAAKMAGQEEPAKFMEKVYQACTKYYVAPTTPTVPAIAPPVPSAASTNASGLLTPGAGPASGAGALGSGLITPGSGASGSGLITPGSAAGAAAGKGLITPGGSGLITPGLRK